MFLRIGIITFFILSFLHADEVRPSYLELTEHANNTYEALFKVPARGDNKLSLHVKLPDMCHESSTKQSSFIRGAYIERWRVQCNSSLRDKTLSIEGLENTKTDLLLRIEFLDNSSQSVILTPTQTSYTLLKKTSFMQVAGTYTWLGITHILMGYDHLMFVFALLLIVKSMRKLLFTISAFTLAHSITLAGATLGLIHVPQAPVEAVIALSILFLAVEIMYEREGKAPSITARYPWVVAFIFGLLHGFGFAGALSEVGVPENAITIALIFFNVGVEIGQILFVSSVVLIGFLLHHFTYLSLVEKLKTVLVYIIGTFSTFWLIERISSF